MRLVVIINAFNEALNIRKAIESVHEVADEIRVFDGSYKDYPHDKPYSTDGTLEIAAEYPKVKIYETNKPYENQMEKRSKMLQEGKEGDYFFILDGDEYVANPEALKDYLNTDIGYAWTLSNLYESPYVIARIIKWMPGLHMAGRHHWIYDGKKRFVCSHQRYNAYFTCQITPIRVFNFRDGATRVNRREKKLTFMKNRNPVELTYNLETDVYQTPCNLKEIEFRASKPREKTVILKEWTEIPKYTFTLMFSRPWAVKRYLECFEKLEIPENTEMIVVIDSGFHMIRRSLEAALVKDRRFTGTKMIITGNAPLPEFSNVNARRRRIISNWNMILTEARGEILLGSEDDSLPAPTAYSKMLDSMDQLNADFIQGNIIGRWHANICPAWKVQERNNKPYAVWSLKEKAEGIEPIEAVGWYCFVANTDIFRKFAMEIDNLMPNGPDLRHGYIMHKEGARLFHRWDVKVEHFTETKRLRVGHDKTEQRGWIKSKSGDWLIRKYDLLKSTFESHFEADVEKAIRLDL